MAGMTVALLAGCGVYLPNCTHYKPTYFYGSTGEVLLETGATVDPEVHASLKDKNDEQ